MHGLFPGDKVWVLMQVVRVGENEVLVRSRDKPGYEDVLHLFWARNEIVMRDESPLIEGDGFLMLEDKNMAICPRCDLSYDKDKEGPLCRSCQAHKVRNAALKIKKEKSNEDS